MSTSVGGISVFLTDNSAAFQNGMLRNAQIVEQSTARMRSSVAGAESSVKSLGNSTKAFAPDAFRSLSISALRAKSDVEGLRAALLAVPALAGGFGGAILAQQITQRADSYTNLKNRIASVVEGQRDQIGAERDLFDVAQKTRTSLASNASLFARLKSSSPDLAADSEKLLRTVETVQKSFAVGGATTQEAQSSALQLAQALGSGRLQGDELRSILENNIPLAKLIAKEFGVGIGQLKDLGSEGTLTSDRVIKAILNGSQEIDTIFARLKPTFASSLQVLDNSLTKTIGKFDEATGLSSGLAAGIIKVAGSLDTLASAGIIAGSVLTAALLGKGGSSAIEAVRGRYAEEVSLRKKAAADAISSAAATDAAVGAARIEQAKATQEKLIAQQKLSYLRGELDKPAASTASLQRAEKALSDRENQLAKSNSKLETLANQRAAIEQKIASGGAGSLARIDQRIANETNRNVTLAGQVASAQSNVTATRADPGAADLQKRTVLSQQYIQVAGQLGVAEKAAAAATADLAAKNTLHAAAMQTSAAAAGTLGTASTVLGAALGATARGLSAVMAFLGGPIGLALTAVSLGFAAYGISAANAAAEQERFKKNAEGIPELLARIAAAQQGAANNSLRVDLNSTLGTAVQAQADAIGKALSEVNRVATLAGSDGVKKLNDELGVVATKGQSAEQAFRGYAARALESKEGTDRLRAAMESLGATNMDLSGPIAEMLRVLGAAVAAAGQVNALRNAMAGLSSANATVVGARDEALRRSTENRDLEGKISGANRSTLDQAQQTVEAIDQQNRKLEVQAGIARRLEDAGRNRRQTRQDELKESILSDSRKAGAALSEAEARKQALLVEGVEFATAEGQKKGRKGGGGGKGFTPAQNFDNKIARIQEEGRAAFFTDLDRQLISELKELKADPGLAKRTTDAIISGGELPERARELRAALELKKAGAEARTARDQYGTLAEVLPQVEERQRLLNIAVEKGWITQDTANRSVQAYAQSLPQLQQAMALADGISSAFERAVTSFDGSAKSGRKAIQGFMSDLAKLGAQQFIFEPLKKAIRGLLTDLATGTSGGGSGGGLLGSLFGLFGGGGGVNASFGPGGASSFGAGGYFGLGPFFPAAHSGWVVGSGAPPMMRQVSPSVFNGAPRYHSGLRTNEMATILERGEAVLTQRQQSGMAALASRSYDMQSGGGITQHFNIDAKGADKGSEARIMYAIRQMGEQTRQAASADRRKDMQDGRQ